MRKKISPYLLLLLPFLSCASDKASQENAEFIAEDVVVKNGNSLLWKVEGKDIKTSYFFGNHAYD